HLITIGSLGGSSRDDLYSEDEITDLLQFTQDNRLEPIQLVQSLGHLEFVLKHNEFVHMRELREFPSVLCPTRPGGRELIVAMIHQLLAKQPYARFIHIGADEVSLFKFVHMRELRELRELPSVLCPTRPGGRELIVAMIHQLLAKQPYARFIHIGADEVSLFKFVHMRELRELRELPSVLCPTRPGGRELIVAMIHQLLAKQPYARFIHIGADEAWHMNKCNDCTSKTSCENYGVDSLFLDHIRSIVMDVHKTYPNVQILIWDDMLPAQLHKFVTPVVWNYGPVGGFRLDEQMWLKYEQAFNEINKLEGARLMITGVILTGWSRFDHYATLCELLPVSLPSLASCLRMFDHYATLCELLPVSLPSLASCLRMWTKPDGMPA
ncbi:Hexosaminidase D, partial [Operophtera brumata]